MPACQVAQVSTGKLDWSNTDWQEMAGWAKNGGSKLSISSFFLFFFFCSPMVLVKSLIHFFLFYVLL